MLFRLLSPFLQKQFQTPRIRVYPPRALSIPRSHYLTLSAASKPPTARLESRLSICVQRRSELRATRGSRPEQSAGFALSMAPHPIFQSQTTALITGAASGIGLAIAQLCARHGMKLALVDVHSANLATVASSLKGPGEAKVDAETYVMDVSKAEEWATLKTKVDERFPSGIGFLVLNAGVQMPSGWDSADAYHQIFSTNFFGPLHGLTTFLPHLRSSASPSSPRSIVLTGSKQGITNPPGNPAYNASKAALKSLAESLSFDLQDYSHISVHLLVPGWTWTGLTGGGRSAVKSKPAGAWSPEQVAAYLEEAMGKGEFYVVCPDGEVSEREDRRRMLWAAGDVAWRRPPGSRWREEWRERAGREMEGMDV